MPQEYVKVTFYRGGTIQSPSDPYVIEGEYSSIVVNDTMTLSGVFEFRVINYHNIHTDQFFSGDIVEIEMGNTVNNTLILGGLIFNVEYEEDSILVKGYDWAHYLVGPRVVQNFSNVDFSEVLRGILLRYVPNLQYNHLLDTGYIIPETYYGGYNNVLNIFNDITEEVGYDWRVRPDREVVLMPNGLQIDFIDGFNEEDDDEDPDGWTEHNGTWYVSGNKYFNQNNVHCESTTSVQVSSYLDVRCIVNMSSAQSTKNGGIVFDWISATDFKYARIQLSGWQIGHYDGSFNTDASSAEGLSADTDYRMQLVINGTTVTFYGWNTSTEVWNEKCTYDFGSMGIGTIGVMTTGPISDTTFDDFVIYSAGIESIDVDIDALNWSIARRDFRDMVNRVTVIGGKEKFEDDFSSGSLWSWGDFYQSGTTSTVAIVSEELEIDCEADATAIQWTQGKYKNQSFSTIINAIDKGGEWINVPALVFRATDDTNYYRARMDCDSDKISVYKVVSGTPTLLKEVSFTFNVSTNYTIRIKTNEENIKVYVDEANKLDFKDTTYSSGFSGLEVVDGKATFNNVSIITDRDVIASASDAALIDRWGEKSADPIRDDSIANKNSALNRAILELNRYRFEKTRGMVKIIGDITILTGDVITLTAIDSSINAEEYRIFGVAQIIDDSEGYITILNVAENFPGVEDVIRAESTSRTYLSWIGILTRTLIESMSDIIGSITDSVDLEDRDFRAFYFDYHDTAWGYSYWDFSAFY